MINKKSLIAGLALSGLWISGCKRTETPPPLEQEIRITITAPLPDAVFGPGESVILRASVLSPTELHGYSWTLVNRADGSILYEESEHAHGKTLDISATWTPEGISGETDVELKVTAEIDHSGKNTSQSVFIKLLP